VKEEGHQVFMVLLLTAKPLKYQPPLVKFQITIRILLESYYWKN